ncbi:hypothetical protein B1R94_22485 [Mycolicibacterium litorale]|nr:hypothetical protein B1R94_22485 [Mycolicibacterium litorale]
MASVRDILEIFGAIDRAIVEADGDPELTATAEKVLPGSAAHAGWYGELESRFFGDQARTPDLAAALGRIAEADERDERLTQNQKARLLYGIAASARIKRVAPTCSLPAFTAPDGSEFGGALIGSLAAIAPDGTALDDRRARAAEVRGGLLHDASTGFVRPGDFDTVRDQALNSIRFGSKLQAPLCQTAVITVNGHESVVVDTKFTSDAVSLDELKRIVNPFNWADDYPQLFVRMQGQEPDILPDGWRRVLETVRLIESVELTTPLKFYPYADPARPLEAHLDYDLDESGFDTGDGQVLVDRGFINMRAVNESGSPGAAGVRVATRKVVHITGISAFAQARLVCIGGYGTGSADFLLRSAANPPADPKPFDFPATEDQADADDVTGSGSPPVLHFAPAAVAAWTESVQDLTNGYFEVAEKWLSGGLTLTDIADYSTRLGGSIAAAPWKYLQAMTTPRPPGTRGGGT